MSSDSETSTQKCTLGVRRDLSFLFSDKDGIGGTSRCAVGSDQDGNGPDLAFLDACARCCSRGYFSASGVSKNAHSWSPNEEHLV